MTGFAILGPGVVADFHRKAIEANADRGARLVAVGYYNPERFDQIEEVFGVPCQTPEDVFRNPEVDAVCICTPSGQHAAQAIAAARAGKHVLVEKPMALTLADADAMLDACRRADVKLGVVFQRRAEPLFRRVKAAVQAGEIGKPTMGIVSVPYYRPQGYYDQAAWRGTWAEDGGGVLMNQGIHLVDLLLWYLGNPVETVAHAVTLHHAIEVEDTLTAALRFENGALATISATTTAAPGFPHRLEIYGTAGGIQIEGEDPVRWRSAGGEPARAGSGAVPATKAAAGGDPKAIPLSGHIGIIADFIDSIRQNKSPLVNGSEGRRSLAAVLAIYQAAKRG